MEFKRVAYGKKEAALKAREYTLQGTSAVGTIEEVFVHILSKLKTVDFVTFIDDITKEEIKLYKDGKIVIKNLLSNNNVKILNIEDLKTLH